MLAESYHCLSKCLYVPTYTLIIIRRKIFALATPEKSLCLAVLIKVMRILNLVFVSVAEMGRENDFSLQTAVTVILFKT